MYKGKPLIIAKRPWWRHPIFPWGWYSLCQDNIQLTGEDFDADGFFSSQGGGGSFTWDESINKADADGRGIIDPGHIDASLHGASSLGSGVWVRTDAGT